MRDTHLVLAGKVEQSLSQLSDSTLHALKELLREGEAANTVRSYQSAMRYWAGWHQFRLGQAIRNRAAFYCGPRPAQHAVWLAL